jgi:hypothetical protein
MDLHERLSRTAPDQAERMLFLTGGAFTERAREFTARREDRCVEKPFDSNRLRALVNRLVG